MTSMPARGACPGLSTPLVTGDGLLARFTPSGPIAPGVFIAFCTAARRHSNGTVEITGRGSLQIRGLTSASAELFAAEVAALDIAASEAVRLVVDPLPDDPDTLIDAADLATRVHQAVSNAQLVLAPKVCVTIDGGGRLHLDALAADVRLRAIATARAPRLYIAVAGTAVSAIPLGSIAPDTAVSALLRILGTIAARGHKARAVDIIRTEGVAGFCSVLGRDFETGPGPLSRPPANPVGKHPLRDGSIALGIALPFGHAHADTLAELMRAAAALGVHSARPAPGRTLLLIGSSAATAAPLAAAAEQLGFIVCADDPRRRIIACPGKPACGSGLIAARALAAELAPHLPVQGDAVHISGCCKGCAHPTAAALTVIGSERGCGIVQHGSAAAAPRYYVDPADIIDEIMQIIGTGEAVHG